MQTEPVAGYPVYTEARTKQCKPAPATGVEVECTSSNGVVVKWSPAVGADKYKVSVTGRTQAPARPSVDDRTVVHFDPPSGQKLNLPVPGRLGWDYTASVTSVKTVAGSESGLESAAASSSGSVRCEGIEMVCQADGRLKTTWVRNPSATRYRLQIFVSTTTSSQVAQLPDIYVAQPAQVARTVIGYYENARAGNRYEVRVAAEVDGAFTTPTTPAGDTCEAIAPPAPTGVTASCSSGTLTVTWNSAGEGLAKATSYKPRIFTGNPLTESTDWTANTAGHDMTTATIPATGEDDLPTTGIFQVKVKATNTAGDSPYSDPVEATCGKPGPVDGVECTVVSDGSITIEWNPVVGADGYQAVASIWDVSSPLNAYQLGWEDAGIPRKTSSGKFVYELDGLDSEVDYYLGVRARNSSGLGDLGSDSVRQCETIDDDWFAARCTGDGVLVAEWSDPSGELPNPSNYSVTARMASAPYGSGVVGTYSGVGLTRSWLVTPNRAYQVDIATENASGGPVYAKTKRVKCPLLSSPVWGSPNTTGSDFWDRVLTAIETLGDSTSPIEVVLAPVTIGVEQYYYTDYQIALASRTCQSTVSGGHTTQTCDEVWDERIEVRLDESSLDQVVDDAIEYLVPDVDSN